MYTMYTSPSFGIGERTILLTTPHGTVMWDLLAYLDDDTIAKLKAPPFNGLEAIVISHPHYYTNHLDWAEAFDCPVYIAAEDEIWTCQKDIHGRRKLIVGTTEEIVPNVTAIKVGGHFPGSLVLHWEDMLLIADSIVTQPVSENFFRRGLLVKSISVLTILINSRPFTTSTVLRVPFPTRTCGLFRI